VCPSEVSDIEFSLWRRYQARGLVVWGIGGEDDIETLRRFRDQMGLTFPILYDAGTLVLNTYGQLRHQFGTRYPQDWIIGPDGRVLYFNDEYDNDAMADVIEAALDEAGQ